MFMHSFDELELQNFAFAKDELWPLPTRNRMGNQLWCDGKETDFISNRLQEEIPCSYLQKQNDLIGAGAFN